MTPTQARKAANSAPKYVLALDDQTFLADDQRMIGDINLTEDVKDAMQFAVGFDNPDVKLGYWNARAARMFNNAEVKFYTVNL